MQNTLQPGRLDEMVGLRLSIARRAADMLGLHFGDIRPHRSGEGNTGAYILHVQCPWRIDGAAGTITGGGDLWEYVGPGKRPRNWSHEDGWSLQDRRLADVVGPYDEGTRSWYNTSDRLVVIALDQSGAGDIRLELSGGYRILVFPESGVREAWRFFSPGDSCHLVFPERA